MYTRQIDLFLRIEGVEAATIASGAGWDIDRLDAAVRKLEALGLAPMVQAADPDLDRPFTGSAHVGDGATIRCERPDGSVATECLAVGIFPDWVAVRASWPCRFSDARCPAALRTRCEEVLRELTHAATAPVVAELPGQLDGPSEWIEGFAQETLLLGFPDGPSGPSVVVDPAPGPSTQLSAGGQASASRAGFSAVPRPARRRFLLPDIAGGVTNPARAAVGLGVVFPGTRLYDVTEEGLVRRARGDESPSLDILVSDSRELDDPVAGVTGIRVEGRLRDELALLAVATSGTAPSTDVVSAVTHGLGALVDAGYEVVRDMGSGAKESFPVTHDAVGRRFTFRE